MTHVRQIVVINLDRDKDRLAHMTRQLQAHHLKFTRFSAVDGRTLPDNLEPYFNLRKHGFRRSAFLSPGEVGCYASHLQICRLVVEGSLQAPLLVLEDDVELPARFPYLLDALTASLPTTWDMVRLSNETKRSYLPVAQLPNDFKLVRYSKIPGSTGATLISQSGAQKFLKRAVRTLPVDQDLKRAWMWNLETFGVLPPLVRRDALEESTIDTIAGPDWRKAPWRIASMRAQRILEVVPRHLNGAKTFGARRWIQAEAINLIIGAVSKTQRAAFLQRASYALSHERKANPGSRRGSTSRAPSLSI